MRGTPSRPGTTGMLVGREWAMSGTRSERRLAAVAPDFGVFLGVEEEETAGEVADSSAAGDTVSTTH